MSVQGRKNRNNSCNRLHASRQASCTESRLPVAHSPHACSNWQRCAPVHQLHLLAEEHVTICSCEGAWKADGWGGAAGQRASDMAGSRCRILCQLTQLAMRPPYWTFL